MPRKAGPVRQLSLQCETARPPLRKQYSEEMPGEEGPIRVSLSAKSRTHVEDRPAPVKIAWSEESRDVKEDAQRGIPQKEAVSNSILHQRDSILAQRDSLLLQKNSILSLKGSQKDSVLMQKKKNDCLSPQKLEKDLMLSQKNVKDAMVLTQKNGKDSGDYVLMQELKRKDNPHDDLAERLRSAWKDRDKSKQNLSIFLAHQQSNDDENAEPAEQEPAATLERVPKIPTAATAPPQHADLKQIFRKHMTRTSANITTSYSPTRTNDTGRSDAVVVVVPIIERPRIAKQASLCETTATPERAKLTKQTSLSDDAEKLFASRPSTATGKREAFQKRAGSALQPRTDGFRPPLLRASSVPSKPENKPKFLATRRRLRAPKKRDKIDEEDRLDAKKGDIVTMVSLVSPSGSDCEEEDKPQSPAKEKNEPTPNTPGVQRKLPKSVSFQHSSMHTVRSFSASFPSRRGSIATTALLIGGAAKKLASQKCNEKRGNDDDQIGPKRRLLRAASLDTKSPDGVLEAKKAEKPCEPAESLSVKSENATEEEKKVEEVVVEEEEDDPKEKECWNMYCKMNQRGLAVSFDTILRGMLTPTEYRIRRKIIEKREAEINPPTVDE